MRLGTIIRSYVLTDYLKPCIKQYDWVEKVLVINNKFPSAKVGFDNTEDIVKELSQDNVELVKRDGLEMHIALRLGLDMLKDMDAVFISDADEFILRADQEKIANGIKGNAGICPIVDYIVDFGHTLPLRTHRPLVIAKHGIQLLDYRNYWDGADNFNDCTVHHLGYVLSEEHMRWKKEWEDKDEPGMWDGLVCQTHIQGNLPNEIRELIKRYN